MVKIKIRLKSGKWLSTKAHPTSHPKLFVTQERYRPLTASGKPAKRGTFLEDQWTITHRPSGYSILWGTYELTEARDLAELFANSSIPWEELRSKRDAKKHTRQYKAVLRKFYKRKLPENL